MGLREEQIQFEGNSLLLDLKMEGAPQCPLGAENPRLTASEEGMGQQTGAPDEGSAPGEGAALGTPHFSLEDPEQRTHVDLAGLLT